MNESPAPAPKNIQPGRIMLCVPNREYPSGAYRVKIINQDPALHRFWWCEPTDGRRYQVRYHESALDPIE